MRNFSAINEVRANTSGSKKNVVLASERLFRSVFSHVKKRSVRLGVMSLLMVFMLSVANSVFAQTAASYGFLRSTNTYASVTGLAGTTNLTTIAADDVTQTGIPIGFNFVYCGTTYTQLSACSNGWVSLANSTSTQWTNTAANIAGAGFLNDGDLVKNMTDKVNGASISLPVAATISR